MEANDDVLKCVRKVQNIHFELLNGSSFDVVPYKDLDKFKIVLGNYFAQKVACDLHAKIIKKNDLYFRIIIVSCIFEGKLINFPVIRVVENGKHVFYDQFCRKYCNWEDFLCCNKLPKCSMIFPVNGLYKKENGKVKLGHQNSPASNWTAELDEKVYLSANIASVVCTIAPLFSFMEPYANYVKVASGVSNGYMAAHDAYNLYDRYRHDQSIALSDPDAAMHWSHIGNRFVTIALTCARSDFGTPSPDLDLNNILNLMRIIQTNLIAKDPNGSLNIIRRQILCQHMLYLTDNATIFFQDMLPNTSDIGKVLSVLRNISGKMSGTFRHLICVDDMTLKKAAKCVRDSNEIHGGMETKNYDIVSKNRITVEDIMTEVEAWETQTISDEQLKFRITEICHGGKKYETVSEMCHYFKAKNVGDIEVNGRKIFNNVGSGTTNLANLIQNAAKKYPQLLLYAVEYAGTQNGDDWEGFQKYFKDRILKEDHYGSCLHYSKNALEWINAISFQEISFSRKKSENSIDFLKPKDNLKHSVSVKDLLKLGKRMLGTFKTDVILAKPNTEWVVIISRNLRSAVIIAPKVNLSVESINGSYLVFVRHF